MSMEKKVDEKGNKIHQRDDYEDRAKPYRQWMYVSQPKGWCMDADMLHWKFINGNPVVYAIIELTCAEDKYCVDPDLMLNYCCTISNRFKRDGQGAFTKALSKMLKAPAYIVVFSKEITTWLWTYSFKYDFWLQRTPKEWLEYIEFLHNIKK